MEDKHKNKNIIHQQLDDDDEALFDPLKKFQIQSFMSQQLIGKLESQVMKKFAKLYDAPVDDRIYDHLSETNKDVGRFMTLILEEMQINLQLANLPYVYQPFKRIQCFMNNLMEITLRHLDKLSKQVRIKESIIQGLKQKQAKALSQTIGVISEQELEKLRRLQIQQEQRQKYRFIEDEDFMRQLQNILKHRIYQQNYKDPETTNELLDIKQKMQEICNFTQRISMISMRGKLDIINNQQMLLQNRQLIKELTKDIQQKFRNLFKNRYIQSIENNSQKLCLQKIENYKQSLVSVQIQTVDIKKPKEHLPRDIEQKNKTIEILTNRSNLYERKIQQNKHTMIKMQQQISKHKAVCNDFAKRHQQMEDTIKHKNKFHNAQIKQLQQEIKLRDVNIKKLTILLEAQGITVPTNTIETQTEEQNQQHLEVATQTEQQEKNQKGIELLIQNYIRSKSKKRISVVGSSQNLKKSIAKRKGQMSNYLLNFLEYLAQKSSHVLYSILQRLQIISFNKMKIAVEKVFEQCKYGQNPKIFVNCAIQTGESNRMSVIKNNLSVVIQCLPQNLLQEAFQKSQFKRPRQLKYSKVITGSQSSISNSQSIHQIQQTNQAIKQQSRNKKRGSTKINYNKNKINQFEKIEKIQQYHIPHVYEKPSAKASQVLKNINIFQNISNPSPKIVETPKSVSKKYRKDFVSSQSSSVIENTHKIQQSKRIKSKRDSSRNLKSTEKHFRLNSQESLNYQSPLIDLSQHNQNVVGNNKERLSTVYSATPTSKNKTIYPTIKQRPQNRSLTEETQIHYLTRFSKSKQRNTRKQNMKNWYQSNINFKTVQPLKPKIHKPKTIDKFESFQVFSELQQTKNFVNPKRSFFGNLSNHKTLQSVILSQQLELKEDTLSMSSNHKNKKQ